MEIRDLNQLNLQIAKKATEDAIKRFIRNDSQNRKGVWGYITGYSLVNGKLEKAGIEWKDFFKWFRDRNWQLCHFDTFENDARDYGYHQWVFEPINGDFDLEGNEYYDFNEYQCQLGISQFFENGVDVTFAAGFIFVTERWER